MDQEQETKRVAVSAGEILDKTADEGIPAEEGCPWSSRGSHSDPSQGFSQRGFCKAVKCRYADCG